MKRGHRVRGFFPLEYDSSRPKENDENSVSTWKALSIASGALFRLSPLPYPKLAYSSWVVWAQRSLPVACVPQGLKLLYELRCLCGFCNPLLIETVDLLLHLSC